MFWCLQEPMWIGTFDNIGTAFLRLFVLFTNENYPMFIEPAHMSNPATFIYFFVFIYIGLFFLNSLILALVRPHCLS